MKGDRVIVYMPMIPEAIVAMLACARLGAIHSVVFGGFAAPELAARIDDAKPVAVVTASCGIEPGRVLAYKGIIDEALRIASHQPQHVVLKQRPEQPAELPAAQEHDWDDVMRRGASVPADCVEVGATDPLYILYTSGTTGRPKGIVRDNGGHAVALAWSLRNVYDVQPGQVWWSASDIGWVVGHSYIVYAPLITGATTVLYEGKPIGTPDAGAFWRVVAEHRVEGLFTAPTDDGYLYVMGRTDDVINVAGHRLSTGSIEAVLAQHPAVAECAVIGVVDQIKSQMPRGFVLLKAGASADPDALAAELRQMVRDQIGAIASLKDVAVVDGLPKTRSGKILRKCMREIADHGTTVVPSTIEDPGVLDRLRPLLRPAADATGG